MPGGTISKQIGTSYEVVWNRESFTIQIFYKGKLKETYQLKRFTDSLDVYASLKQVKDCKYATEIHQFYPVNLLRRKG